MIRTALVGYGLAGRAFHAPLVRASEGFALDAVVTSRRTQVEADFPGALVVPELADVLAMSAIELVIIATPNDSHSAYARAAIEAGKHVVIDKPIALDSGEARELAAAACAAERMLTIFHNRRWDSDFLTVKRLLEQEALGEILLASACWDRFRPALRDNWHEAPGKGGGVLIDLGPHLIDQALQLFGLPDAIDADIGAQRAGSQVDDYFYLTLHYGARRVELASAPIVAEPRPRFALHGLRGSFRKHGLDPQEAVLRAQYRADQPDFGVEAPEQHGVLTLADGSRQRVLSERGDYRRFYAGVRDCLRYGASPPVDALDAANGLQLIEWARRSASEGRRLRCRWN